MLNSGLDPNVKPISKLRYFQLAMFSNPACDRVLYKAIKKYKIASIVEIGLGNLVRAENMIRVATRFAGSSRVRYTGVDLFEGRPDSEPSVRFKDAHQRLKKYDVRLQLAPGEVFPALTRIANSHMRTDLIVVSAGYDSASLVETWFYIPRMLHAASLFFIQDPGDISSKFERLSRVEIERKSTEMPAASQQAA